MSSKVNIYQETQRIVLMTLGSLLIICSLISITPSHSIGRVV
jgi:hypothetical protein